MNDNRSNNPVVLTDHVEPVARLSMQNLGKRYGKRWVVKDVSFSVEQGQVVGLLGPNGAGKTTSFYMVVGLVNMDKGRVTLGNMDLSKYAMHERARAGIGYLPQEASIFRKLSIEDNILAILQTRKDLNSNQQRQELEKLIDDFHLEHVRKSLGMSVSGGERRRCEIARALAADPKFILLDEPFAGVDPISVGDIKDVILALKRRGIGVLITDHNVRETLAICEKAYIVSEGAIIAEGTSEEVLENELVKSVYLGKDFQV
nr:LPS export ABC transporter ATP-binding protein [Psychrobacter sp. DD43]